MPGKNSRGYDLPDTARRALAAATPAAWDDISNPIPTESPNQPTHSKPARDHASGVDDIAGLSLALRLIMFFDWVTFDKRCG